MCLKTHKQVQHELIQDGGPFSLEGISCYISRLSGASKGNFDGEGREGINSPTLIIFHNLI